MSEKSITNMAASVRQRLQNLARERAEAFNYVLDRYGSERLLYRLSQSQYGDQFVLKGAALFQLWSGQPHRPTRDIDLLGYGEPSPERFRVLFEEICRVDVEEDGLEFLPETVRAEPIKEEDEYQGIRVKLEARLEKARLSLQVDIGFGDSVWPEATAIQYPTLLNQAVPVLRAYPRETVVAEKFQAMVMLGFANSRMKDFYDLWTLARLFEFDGPTLSTAIQSTFARRQTELPRTTPLALTTEFSEDGTKVKQWTAFLRKGIPASQDMRLNEVVAVLTEFLMPVTFALVHGQPFVATWDPTDSWKKA